MDKQYFRIEDINAYGIAFELSNYVWPIVLKWDYFAKDTIGKQYIRAVDSISANISEGFGRYTKKDKINFFRYSFGSIQESHDWTKKAFMRKLVTEEEHNRISTDLKILCKELNTLIKITNNNLKF